MGTTHFIQLIDFSLIVQHLSFVLSGLWVTLSLAVLSFLLSLIFGSVIAFSRFLKIPILSQLATLYVSFFRGVPALVILFFIYFGMPFFDIVLDAYSAALIGFSLTSSAFTSEVIRSSILAIDLVQWEIALDLGAKLPSVIWRVILPQAGRLAIPSLSNVLLDLIKGTSLTAMITVQDVFQRAKIVAAANNNFITMYLLLAFIYWGLCLTFEQGQRYLEHKFNLTKPQMNLQHFM